MTSLPMARLQMHSLRHRVSTGYYAGRGCEAGSLRARAGRAVQTRDGAALPHGRLASWLARRTRHGAGYTAYQLQASSCELDFARADVCPAAACSIPIYFALVDCLPYYFVSTIVNYSGGVVVVCRAAQQNHPASITLGAAGWCVGGRRTCRSRGCTGAAEV